MTRKMLSSKNLWQFISYFGVGGAAALVEWAVFFFLEYAFNLPYLLATILAFIVSTTANWFLGRIFTFKDSAYKDKKLREIVLVFLVSAIGLVFNLLLMYLFVSVFQMNTNILKTVSKITATGIVFVWNFMARKKLIYKAR